ncbi:MAG: hypothetical protein CBC48_15465 [bacterium TMED88]|nr:hypothetical protein [Deltaproteobacteria bacterium]OUV26449.1 MAG: hypothetical protein CBC48_15465 [bacterium TMED88]
MKVRLGARGFVGFGLSILLWVVSACDQRSAQPSDFVSRSELAVAEPLDQSAGLRDRAKEEEGREAFMRLLVWPSGQGDPPDAESQFDQCFADLQNEVDPAELHPLQVLVAMRDCMALRGWTFKSAQPSR